MSLMRPEARATLWRWREVLVALGAGTLGGWWALTSFGLLRWLGVLLVAGAAALLVAGVQRARFRGTGGGAGVVTVDEGQISYFGPQTGGLVGLGEIEALHLDPGATPSPVWILARRGQPDLAIPVDAEGADALFDAFAALPGIRTHRLAARMQAQGASRVLIWRRGGALDASRRLH